MESLARRTQNEGNNTTVAIDREEVIALIRYKLCCRKNIYDKEDCYLYKYIPIHVYIIYIIKVNYYSKYNLGMNFKVYQSGHDIF